MTKTCSTCNRELPLSEFTKNKTKRDGHDYRCRGCLSEYRKDWYKKNQVTQRKIKKEEKAARVLANHRQIETILRTFPCTDCGERDPLVLEFDHVRWDKKHNISHMVCGGYSWEKIAQELQKCEVRCCNCHRRKTRNQRGWYKGD